jgi:hypothetical protein
MTKLQRYFVFAKQALHERETGKDRETTSSSLSRELKKKTTSRKFREEGWKESIKMRWGKKKES